MLPKCFHVAILIVVSLQVKGVACFFVRKALSDAYKFGIRAICMKDTGWIQSSGSWGNLSSLQFSPNSCLDPSAQFRFRDNGAMLNLRRQGCLAAFHNASGYNLDIFCLYVDSVSLDTNACAQKPNEGIYRAINQTTQGALSVYYKGRDKRTFQTWCMTITEEIIILRKRRHALPSYHYGVLLSACQPVISSLQKVILGSVTCYGEMVKNANCPKDQYMVVKIASVRGLIVPKLCGISDDYSCIIDVTCLVKKQCDGLHECNITVDDNLFSPDLCPGLSNYLHFEYECGDNVKPYNEPCINDVSLSNKCLPYKGVVQINIDCGIKNVCRQSLSSNAYNIICRQLGYIKAYFVETITTPVDAKDSTFSGSISCNGDEEYLSQCSINTTSTGPCSELTHIHCVFEREEPLLYDKRKFPDLLFSASASLEGHSASDARICSGSSWCVPSSLGRQYLQVDFGKSYFIAAIITYGDRNSSKWVAEYRLNYTDDLVHWKTSSSLLRNKHANGYGVLRITTRAVRIIPVAFIGQACMRVDFWGQTALPDKPRNLSVTNVTSTSVAISWADPKNRGVYGFPNFLIKLKRNNVLIRSVNTGKVNKYLLHNLISYTTYEIFVSAGSSKNQRFGEEAATTFVTLPKRGS